jgi:hypothetical protein
VRTAIFTGREPFKTLQLLALFTEKKSSLNCLTAVVSVAQPVEHRSVARPFPSRTQYLQSFRTPLNRAELGASMQRIMQKLFDFAESKFGNNEPSFPNFLLLCRAMKKFLHTGSVLLAMERYHEASLNF